MSTPATESAVVPDGGARTPNSVRVMRAMRRRARAGAMRRRARGMRARMRLNPRRARDFNVAVASRARGVRGWDATE